MSVAPPPLLPRRDQPLAPLTSLKVGGAANYYLATTSWEQVERVLGWAAEQRLPVTFLGGGSNLLVSDSGVEGLVVRALARGVEWPTPERPVVVPEAGHAFPGLARELARRGWGGLEWAANVPGTVGGAVVNNAGAFGSCVAERLLWVEVLDAAGRRRLEPAKLDYAYRASRLKRRELGALCVTRAAFRLHPAPPEVAQATVARFQQQRTATQPRENSAGSVFANPDGDFAGRLIEASGLKGTRRGGAEISRQHANFIVNRGGATARDVYELLALAQRTVWERSGTWLRPEIELLGRWSDEERRALLGPTAGGQP